MSSRYGPRSGGNDLGDLDVHAVGQPGAVGRQARGGIEIVGFDDDIATQHCGAGVTAVRGGQGAGGPDPVTHIGDRWPELAEPGAPRLLLPGGCGPAWLATESNNILAHGTAPFRMGPASLTGLHPLRRTPSRRIDKPSIE